MSKLDEFIDRAGDGAVIMMSPEARRDIRNNTSVHDWCFVGNREIYRGASVVVHDEWSWGWMVRRRDGSFVEDAQGMAPEGRGREGGPGSSELPSPVGGNADAPKGESR